MQYKRCHHSKLSPKSKRSGERILEPCVKGVPKKKLLENYGLDHNIHPADWFSVFIPFTADENLEEVSDVEANGDGKTKFALSNFTCYTNTKVMIVNASEKGHIFTGMYKPLTSSDLRSILGS